jgi:hypothetical protein
MKAGLSQVGFMVLSMHSREPSALVRARGNKEVLQPYSLPRSMAPCAMSSGRTASTPFFLFYSQFRTYY